MDGAIPPCNVLLNHRPLMHLTSASSTILSGESVSFAFLQYRDLDLSFGNAISGKPQLSQTMKAGVPISHEKKQHTPHHLWCYIFRCTFSACHPPSHGSPPAPHRGFPLTESRKPISTCHGNFSTLQKSLVSAQAQHAAEDGGWPACYCVTWKANHFLNRIFQSYYELLFITKIIYAHCTKMWKVTLFLKAIYI